MRLVFLGPPGAGKGTQARILAESCGCAHISTGDVLREAREKGTPLGEQAKSYMDRGELVPDEVICGVVAEYLARDACATGWILDGFPRTVGQAKALETTIRDLGQNIDACLLFELDREELVERLTGRLTCRSCGAMYHRRFAPPKAEGVCDACGGELYQRPDDSEETVRSRLAVYDEQTRPLVEFYEERNLLSVVDAAGTVDEVAARVAALVSDL